MSKLWRTNLIAFSCCVLAIASGCDKKGSTVAPVPGGPSVPPKADDALYSKKLIGTWEGSEDLGGGKTVKLTAEFKGDGSFKFLMGSDEMKGTWKLVKEEGKTVTVSTDITIDGIGDPKAPRKLDKMTVKAVFEDDNTVVISKEGKEPDPIKFKRKS